MFRKDECNSVKYDFRKAPNIYPYISNDQQFRLNKINEIKYYLIAEIKERQLMSKNLSEYTASFEYLDKSLIVLSVATGSISIGSFPTIIGVPVGIISASCSLAFSITTGLVKKFLKTIRNKKKKHNKIVMLARTKLNSIERKISEALINNEIIHEDFMTILNEEKKYQINKLRELKESIRMLNSQRSHVEKISLTEEGKKITINEDIKCNEIINDSLKYTYKNKNEMILFKV